MSVPKMHGESKHSLTESLRRKQLAMVEAKALFLVVLFAIISACAGYTWHSTMFQFGEMLDLELQFLQNLKGDISEADKDLTMAQGILGKVRSDMEVQYQQIDRMYKHPVSHYRLLDAWRRVENITVMRSNFFSRRYTFLSESDRLAVLSNLYSIQISHGLKAEDLARGVINGYRGYEMTADDCADMGNLAVTHENNRLAVQWFEECLKKIMHGEKSAYNKTIRDGMQKLQDLLTCEDLCKEGREVTRRNKNLKCYMWDNFHDPWMVLQPVKMEILDTEPYVYRFYDVISDHEIIALKSLSWKELKDAQTQGDADAHEAVRLESTRVAHHFFLDDFNFNKVVARLRNRVEGITGLSLETSEALQVATYGIGGHYEPHCDAENNAFAFHEERAATFMFYLSDVQNGGATVFVRSGIAVRPQKGSALFWYNLYPSGNLDLDTKHCACPILVGNKWIANQWIKQTRNGICQDLSGLGRIKTSKELTRKHSSKLNTLTRNSFQNFF